MTAFADLEIGLHRREAGDNNVEMRYRREGGDYAVELRLSLPNSDADVGLAQGEQGRARFDLEQLRRLELDDMAYGRCLAEGLLGEGAVGTAFAQARAAAQGHGAALRVRLLIGPSALELQGLRWEMLRDVDGTPLCTGEQMLFSRYLSSADLRPVGPRPQGALRALVVIANPAGLDEYQPGGRALVPVDVAGELERARAGLSGIEVTELASGGTASLKGMADALREGYDVLYLVCHGALVQGEPWLWLEDDAGLVAPTQGQELVTRLKELAQLPRLAVLASCQSGGTGEQAQSEDEGALAGLGPRLAEVGVPAVIAMQGNVTMGTAGVFMVAFFRELQRDGRIDRAMAVARGTVRERPDWWVPVLYMRLRDGRLFEPAGPDSELEIPRAYYEPETVYVPAGPFLMGSSLGVGVPVYETPQHTLSLPAFRIGRTPVTNGQYAEFLRENPSQKEPGTGDWWNRKPPQEKLEHPVAAVSWTEAQDYCAWLAARTGRHYRLPSEAEWEKAARGSDGRIYPWGDAWQEGACQADSATTAAVGAHPQGVSVHGCLDMLGNVQEWTRTRWGTARAQPQYGYPYRPDDGREDAGNLAAGEYVVCRGGSYRDRGSDVRCSTRGMAKPESRVPWRGFRVVQEL